MLIDAKIFFLFLCSKKMLQWTEIKYITKTKNNLVAWFSKMIHICRPQALMRELAYFVIIRCKQMHNGLFCRLKPMQASCASPWLKSAKRCMWAVTKAAVPAKFHTLKKTKLDQKSIRKYFIGIESTMHICTLTFWSLIYLVFSLISYFYHPLLSQMVLVGCYCWPTQNNIF